MERLNAWQPLWPLGPFDDRVPRCNTYDALQDVLERLPHEAVLELVGRFSWDIPDPWALGLVVPPSDRPSIYLSPKLEVLNRPLACAVIAHELAHIYLDHDAGPHSLEDEDEYEEAAWAQVAAWGFESEAQAHQVYRKRQDANGARWARNA